MSQRKEGADVIQTVGLISFVAIWVGSVIAVFDAGLWLKEDSVYTNALTYGMATFTLQGMGFFFYKLLVQDSLESNAKIARMQRDQKEQMQTQQLQFSQKQMEMEMRKQQLEFEQQISMLEDDPEVVQYMAIQQEMMRRAKQSLGEIPQHGASTKEPLDLGASKARNPDGTFAKKEE